jgi:hypothetical protein
MLTDWRLAVFISTSDSFCEGVKNLFARKDNKQVFAKIGCLK